MDEFAVARAIGAIIFSAIAGAAGYYIGAPYHTAIESMFAMGLAVGAATALFGLLPLDYIASLLFGFALMFLPWTTSYLLGMFITASSGLAMLGNMVTHFYLDTEKEKLRSL
jgi:hypothetical protein